MTKIIRLASAKRPAPKQERPCRCDHKYVTVYASSRTVSCVTCGALLDPFDVLLDMAKGYVPAMPCRDEEQALALEIVKRRNKTKQEKEPEKE